MKTPFTLLTLATLTACHPQSHAPNAASTAIASSTAPAHKPCGSLKTVQTADELLQQIRGELGSSCLFDLSAAELEAAWGLKVFDYRNQSEEQRDAQFEAMLAYDQTQTALYIKRLPPSPNDFTYNHTDEIQIAKSSGKRYNLGGDSNQYALPAGFPPPNDTRRPEEIKPTLCAQKSPKPSDYQPFAFHIWTNPEHRADLPQLVIFADGCGAPETITVYRQALSGTYPFYCTDLAQCTSPAASEAASNTGAP
ncbi:hypothetical protein [Kingella oralis]|uniref:Lipoprotein n=1 Tax=Kingella oralis ATCC 51147 TaxID=629741 RepID=C4GFH1_9NEIS|nr:hypothetical protein [Kingella oralis]EEP68976.1 hypothetical protein GCWU000324_00887 [Kingella oralis ATCC 51147]QMT41870.1 hypothetical protein H3L93_07375 [Kingella oralis]